MVKRVTISIPVPTARQVGWLAGALVLCAIWDGMEYLTGWHDRSTWPWYQRMAHDGAALTGASLPQAWNRWMAGHP